MSSIQATTQSSVARLRGIRFSPRVVRAVDLAGQLAAPIAVVIALIVAALFAPAFYNPTNLKTVLIQIAVLGIVAIGQTLVLLVRSIDLSVSAVLALGAVIVVQTEGGSSILVPMIEAFGVEAFERRILCLRTEAGQTLQDAPQCRGGSGPHQRRGGHRRRWCWDWRWQVGRARPASDGRC